MKKLVALLLVLMLALGMTASAENTDKKLTVGFAFSGLTTNPPFIKMDALISSKCAERGWEYISVNIENAETMMTAFETFISAKCDIVIFQNSYEDVCADQITQLREMGCVLGSFDKDSELCQYSIYASNYEMGLVLGRECGKWVNEHEGSKKLGILYYALYDFIVERANGIRDGFLEVCPDGEVSTPVHTGSVAESVGAMENLLQVMPDVQVVGTTGDYAAIGAMEACRAAGLSLANGGPAIWGVDGSDDGLAAVKEQVCTIALDLVNQTDLMFERCVQTALIGEIDEANTSVPYPMVPTYYEDIVAAE